MRKYWFIQIFRKNGENKLNNRGSVLIFLLLITGVISFFLMESLYYAKLNQRLCYNYYNNTIFENKMKKIAFIFGELIKNKVMYNDYFDKDIGDYFSEEEPLTIDNEKYFIVYKPESSLVDINRDSEDKIKEAVLKFADDKFDETYVDTIVDSIMDWKDSDNLERPNGAEKDYYKKLGYEPANGSIYDLFELKKIKGINDENFFKIEYDDNNRAIYSGLLTYFTIYKNGFYKYDFKNKKLVAYKNIFRLYIRSALHPKNIYLIFVGEKESRFYLIKWKKLT